MSGVEEQSRCPLGWRDARCGRFGPCGCEPPISPVTGPAVPSDEELREALARWLYLNTAPPSRYPGEGGRVWLAGDVLDLADALLPVVRRYADQRAAEELRAIGRAGLAATPGAHPVRIPVGYLFARADALAREATR